MSNVQLQDRIVIYCSLSKSGCWDYKHNVRYFERLGFKTGLNISDPTFETIRSKKQNSPSGALYFYYVGTPFSDLSPQLQPLLVWRDNSVKVFKFEGFNRWDLFKDFIEHEENMSNDPNDLEFFEYSRALLKIEYLKNDELKHILQKLRKTNEVRDFLRAVESF